MWMTPILLYLLASAWEPLPGEANFLAANIAQRNGQYAAALSAYERCGQTDPDLYPYTVTHRAQCCALLNDWTAADALFREAVSGLPEGPWRAMAQFEWALALKRTGRGKEAIPLFSEALSVEPKPWWMGDCAWAAAENRLQCGETAQAYAWFRELAASTIWLKKRLDAAKLLRLSPDPADRQAALEAFLRSSSYKEALEVLASAPGLRWADGTEASFLSLDKRLSTKELLPERLAWVDGLSQANTESAWTPLWLVYAMRTAASRRNYEEAQAILRLVVQRAPESKEAGDCVWWLAQVLKREGRNEEALALYRELAVDHPKHLRAAEAQMNMAGVLAELGRGDEAATAYTDLGRKFRKSRLASEAYYRAAGLASGPKREKRERLCLMASVQSALGDYYGHRALQRLYDLMGLPADRFPNLRVDGVNAVLQPYVGVVLKPRPSAASEDVRLRRLRFFGVNGLEAGRWEGVYLLNHLDSVSSPEAYYQALAGAGYSHTALQFLLSRNPDAAKDLRDPLRLSLEYPRAYWEDLAALAAEIGLDPFLVLALARQESTFRADIVSRSGAVGVMQVMPSTARWLASKDSRVSPEQAARLDSPRNSLRLGMVYLKQMVDRSGGNLAYALASYNAGPGNCDKWRRAAPERSLDEFIETIPIDETRDYVKRVLGNFAAYHSLYGK